MDSARAIVTNRLMELEDSHVRDWGKIKTEVKIALSDFIWKETQRNPMILPVIQEV